MLSDEWLPRYRLIKNFTMKWNGNGNAHGNGNGNAYDRGDYNSSFALRAVELKIGRSGKNGIERASPITCMRSVDPEQRVLSGLICTLEPEYTT